MTNESASALSLPFVPGAPARVARPRLGRLQRLLVRGGVLLVVIFITITAYALARLHDIAIEGAERHVVNLNRTIAEQTSRAVQAADLIVMSAQSALEAGGTRALDAGWIHDMLEAQVAGVPQVPVLFVVDAAGRIVHSSHPLPPSEIAVADRDYFLAHRDAAASGAYLSAPQFSPLDGGSAIFLSRALHGARGEFAGVVVAPIDQPYFVAFYRSLEFAPGMAVTLSRSDGTLIARFPEVEGAVGRVFHGPVAQALERDPDTRVTHSVSAIDGELRIAAGLSLSDYPLRTYVSITRKAALYEWFRAVLIIGIASAATGVAALVLLLVVFNRKLAGERVLAEALHASEARFRNLTQLSSDWYWEQDADLRFALTAGNSEGCCGFAPGQCIGLRLWELPGIERVDGDWEAHRVDLAARREFYDLLVRRTDALGAVHYLSLSGRPLIGAHGEFKGYEGVVMDVTAKIEAEAREREAARELRMITANVPSAVFRFRVAADGACSFPFMSGHVRNLCGVEAAAAMRDFRKVYRLVRPPFRDGLKRSVTVSMTALAPWDFEFEIRAGDGRMCWLRGQALPRREADGAVVWDGVLCDVTERKHAELEIVRLNLDLEKRVAERTREFQTANAELESFAYSVSHDLRAPLRAINSFSQILRDEFGAALDATARDHLERVRAAGQRMGELVDALLALSRVTRQALRRTRIDVTALVGGIIEELRQLHPAREVDVAIQPGLTAVADPALLRVLLENLVGNAWKFTSKTPRAAIEAGAMTKEGKMVYYVRDNGAGFDMMYASKLFQPFQRLHDRSQFEGTGIGLATVRRIVQRHGGHVWADAAVGGGAAIYFTLAHETEGA